MATFSTNQGRQLFVVNADPAVVTPKSAVGTIKAMNDANHEYIWFKYMGPGGIIASDKIKVSNIVKAKSMKSTAMNKPLNRYKVALDESVHTGIGAEVVAGQNYILRILFDHYIGITEEDTYLKYGMVHTYKGMKADEFYKTLALSIAQNVSRDEIQLLKVYVHSKAKGAEKKNTATNEGFTGGYMEVTPEVKDNKLSTTANPYYVETTYVDDIDSIVIEEVEQPWSLGKMSAGKININLYPTTITVDGDEVIWGKVTEEASKTFITNGKEIADLEWFCAGARGDQYRGVGYPDNIETKYLVDPIKNYDTLDIVYYYAGDNEDIQKSQRTITLVSSDASTNDIMKKIVADVNKATANKPVAIANPENK